jgi:hypothetical protein
VVFFGPLVAKRRIRLNWNLTCEDSWIRGTYVPSFRWFYLIVLVLIHWNKHNRATFIGKYKNLWGVPPLPYSRGTHACSWIWNPPYVGKISSVSPLFYGLLNGFWTPYVGRVSLEMWPGHIPARGRGPGTRILTLFLKIYGNQPITCIHPFFSFQWRFSCSWASKKHPFSVEKWNVHARYPTCQECGECRGGPPSEGAPPL